jgi:hypothetical protein
LNFCKRQQVGGRKGKAVLACSRVGRYPGRRLLRKKNVGVGLGISVLWNKIIADKIIEVNINSELLESNQHFLEVAGTQRARQRYVSGWRSRANMSREETQKQNNNKQRGCDFCARS